MDRRATAFIRKTAPRMFQDSVFHIPRSAFGRFRILRLAGASDIETFTAAAGVFHIGIVEFEAFVQTFFGEIQLGSG